MKSAEVKAYLEVIEAMRQAIEAHGSAGIPSGHLYAMVMSKVSLTTYERMIGLLIEAGRVTKKNHVLVSRDLVKVPACTTDSNGCLERMSSGDCSCDHVVTEHS